MSNRSNNNFYSNYDELVRLRSEVAALRPKPLSAAELLFKGLIDELPKASKEGRIDQWRLCAERIAALIASRAKETVEAETYLSSGGPHLVMASAIAVPQCVVSAVPAP